jgi:carboxylesterase type B
VENTFQDPEIDVMDERCLTLSIYAPNVTGGELLPVAAYIHGGAYAGGASNESRLDGSFFASAQRAVVVVFQYRLNVFGFLGADILRALDPLKSTGNVGLLDQRFALAWIKANIHHFGGDNKRVLLFGQSAGAGSVAAHLVTPRSYGMFHGAVMQSGAFSTWVSADLNDAEATFRKILNASGCGNRQHPAHQQTNSSIIKCLQTISAPELFKLGHTLNVDGWGPTVDGIELTSHPWQLARDGCVAPSVPVIAGSVKEDGGVISAKPTANSTDFMNALLQPSGRFGQGSGFNVSLIQRIYELYTASPMEQGPNTSYSPYYWAGKYILRDAEMLCPARRTAQYFSGSVSSFVYRWDGPSAHLFSRSSSSPPPHLSPPLPPPPPPPLPPPPFVYRWDYPPLRGDKVDNRDQTCQVSALEVQ